MFTPRLLKLKIHSRRVSVFKRLLPICAFLLTSVMIAWPALKDQKDVFSSSVPVKVGIKETQNDMEQVRFFSKDDNQNPFTVVAESVRETDSARQIVLMDKPKATYRMKNKTVLTGITPFGMAFQQEHYLYFEDQVDMTSSDGYQGNSSKVICEYEQGRLGSDSNVYIKGPAGLLTAQGFFAKDNGDYIHFKNHTESLLFHTPKAVSEIEALKYESMQDYLKQNEQNIFIVSDNGLIINQAQQTVKALKNVQITQGNSVLKAPQVTLSYRKLKNGETEVTKFDAENKVTVTTPTQSATGNHLTFYKDPAEIQAVIQAQNHLPELKTSRDSAQMIVLSGQAALQEKENSLKADYITALYDNTGTKIEKVIANQNVFAAQQDKTLAGNRLTVYQNTAEIQTVLKEKTTPELFHTYTAPAGRFVILTGNAVLKDKDQQLTAQNAYALYDEKQENIVEALAEGHARVSQPGQTAQGDRISIYKTPAAIQAVLKTLPDIKEINSSQAPGQIVLIDGNAEAYEKPNKLTANKLYVFYDSKGEKIEKSVAVGNMTAQNETQKIQGEYGVYTTATEVASVYKNVVLTEKDSVLKGNYASLNMKTGISSLTAPAQKNGKKGRVKGSIVPNNFKGK